MQDNSDESSDTSRRHIPSILDLLHTNVTFEESSESTGTGYLSDPFSEYGPEVGTGNCDFSSQYLRRGSETTQQQRNDFARTIKERWQSRSRKFRSSRDDASSTSKEEKNTDIYEVSGLADDSDKVTNSSSDEELPPLFSKFSKAFKKALAETKMEEGLDRTSPLLAERSEVVCNAMKLPHTERTRYFETRVPPSSPINVTSQRYLRPSLKKQSPSNTERPLRIIQRRPYEPSESSSAEEDVGEKDAASEEESAQITSNVTGKTSPRRSLPKISPGRSILPDEEDVDEFSGLWKMLSAYDDVVFSPLKQSHHPEPIPWSKMEESRNKCLEWLEKYHETFPKKTSHQQDTKQSRN